MPSFSISLSTNKSGLSISSYSFNIPSSSSFFLASLYACAHTKLSKHASLQTLSLSLYINSLILFFPISSSLAGTFIPSTLFAIESYVYSFLSGSKRYAIIDTSSNDLLLSFIETPSSLYLKSISFKRSLTDIETICVLLESISASDENTISSVTKYSNGIKYALSLPSHKDSATLSPFSLIILIANSFDFFIFSIRSTTSLKSETSANS